MFPNNSEWDGGVKLDKIKKMWLFNNYNEVEKQLLGHYVQFFTAMGLLDAKKTAKDMLDKAIEKSKKEGTYYLPRNFGNIILGTEKAEQQDIEKMAEMFRSILPQKRANGVKDTDIRWWWNLNDVERYMMLSVDEFHRVALFIKRIEDGDTPDDAGKTVWKVHPIYTYGDPTQKPQKAPSGITEEDYPIPVELKDRVNIYIEKRAKDDPEKYKKEIENSSTFNALLRRAIEASKI